MIRLVFISFLVIILHTACKKKTIHKCYPEYSSATVSGNNWMGKVDVIYKKNILGDNMSIKSFSFFNPKDGTVIDIIFHSTQDGSKEKVLTENDAVFIYRKGGASPFYYSTEYPILNTYGKLSFTGFDDGYGMEGTFEFIAHRTDSSETSVQNGFFSAVDK